MRKQPILIILIGLGLLLNACSNNKGEKNPTTTAGDRTKETFSISRLVKEDKQVPDSVITQLNAQHHQVKVLERRTVSGPFTVPEMKYSKNYAVTFGKLPVINPGPGEYVHVIESGVMDIKNLTVGIRQVGI